MKYLRFNSPHPNGYVSSYFNYPNSYYSWTSDQEKHVNEVKRHIEDKKGAWNYKKRENVNDYNPRYLNSATHDIANYLGVSLLGIVNKVYLVDYSISALASLLPAIAFLSF